MSLDRKLAIGVVRYIADEMGALAPDMAEVAVAALEEQDVFLSGLIQDVKCRMKEIGEGRPTFEEVVEITGQCYASAAQTLNRDKHARLRQVLLNGLEIQDRQHEEHTLLMRAVSDFDTGHIDLLRVFEERSPAPAGNIANRTSAPVEWGQILELAGRGFLNRSNDNLRCEGGVFAVRQENNEAQHMIVEISRLGKRLLAHLS